MVLHHDRVAGEIAPDEIGEPDPRSARDPERQSQHLVEIAIVDSALPVHRDQSAAHHGAEILLAERFLQQLHVGAELSSGDERRAESGDRHVGERVEPVEADAEALAEHPLVVRLEVFLRGRQRSSLRVVHEVEREMRALHAVAERIQALERADARFVYALAALPVDQFFGIAGKRVDDLDTLGGEELREILLAGLFENGEIASVDHVSAERAGAPDELPEMRIQLGCAAGDVERADARGLEVAQHGVHRLPVHLLGARGTRVDVAVHAGLVALVAEVDLKRFQALPCAEREIGDLEKGKRCVHRLFSSYFRACLPTFQPCEARYFSPAAMGSGSSGVPMVSFQRLRKPKYATTAAISTIWFSDQCLRIWANISSVTSFGTEAAANAKSSATRSKPRSTSPFGSQIAWESCENALTSLGFLCMISMLFGTKPRLFFENSKVSSSSGAWPTGSGANRGDGLTF